MVRDQDKEVGSMAVFEVLDLAGGSVETRGSVDLDVLTERLREIRDNVGKVMSEDTQGPLGLDQIEIALTVTAEAGLAFITKGSAEASVTLTFKRS